MTSPSDESVDSLDFNDSDIEKEFNQIKVAGKINNGGNAAAKLPSSMVLPDTNRLNNNVPSGTAVRQGHTLVRSPKPIPKGIDFGHELIGNPRFFSKNNTMQSQQPSDEYLSSNNEDLSGPNESAESYTRLPNMGNVQMFGARSDGEISDDFISGDHSEHSSKSSKRGATHDGKPPQEKFRGGVTPNAKHDVVFNKYQELTQSEVYARKEELLLELEKLREKGVRMEKEYNITSDLSDMERTYMRLKNKKDQTSAIKLMKKVLMGMVSGTEFINQRYNKDNVDLEGWTEHVLINITDYDEIFEELYDKYKTKFAVAPEIKLLMTIFGSAFTFHMSKVLAKQFAPAQRDHRDSGGYKNKDEPPAGVFKESASERGRFSGPVPTQRAKAQGAAATSKGRMTANLANIFGGDNSRPTKGNDELDEIIREIENSQNNLSLPEEEDGGQGEETEDDGYNEILSDSQANETADLNEIQDSKNLIL
jgi:hypothetical protein